MSPRKYRAVVQFSHEFVVPEVGNGVTLNNIERVDGTIASVTPILTAEDVIDEIEKLRDEAMADLDTMLSEPPRINRYRRLTREIDQVIAAHRSQEKPE